jgi:hypothetical protein
MNEDLAKRIEEFFECDEVYIHPDLKIEEFFMEMDGKILYKPKERIPVI